MNLGMLLDMAADGLGDRVALGGRTGGVSFAELRVRARRVAAALAGASGERVGFIDLNSDAVPLALLGAGLAGKPFARSTTGSPTRSCRPSCVGWHRPP